MNETNSDESSNDTYHSAYNLLSKEQYGLTGQVAVTLETAISAKVVATNWGSLDGDWLTATSLTNHNILVYKGEQLNKITALKGHKKMITCLKFSDINSNILYSSSLDGTIRIWDLRLGNSVKEFQDDTDEKFKPITCFDFNCDETFLCGGTELIISDAYLLFWDLRQSKLLGGYWESHSNDVTQVNFHETAVNTLVTGATDGLINLFDIGQMDEDDALLNTFNTESSVDVVEWSQNGACLACLTHIETVQLWSIEQAELLKTYDRDDIAKNLQINQPPTRFVNLVVNRSTGSPAVIAATSAKGTALLIEIEESGLVVHSELEGAHKEHLICADWNVENGMAVTGDENGLLCHWKRGAVSIESKHMALKTISSVKSKITNQSQSRKKPY